MHARAALQHRPEHEANIILNVLLCLTAYTSFLMYSQVTEIDSIHLDDDKNLNSPFPPIHDK